MIDYLKENKAGISIGLVSVMFVLLTAAANGCQLSDFVKVKVPTGVRKSIDVPPQVNLTNVPVVWEDWQNFVETNTQRFEQETERAQEVLGFVSSLADTALAVGGDASSGIPGGALIFGALTGAAGLFIRKPGDLKKMQKEKEASFNAGEKRAKDLVSLAKDALGGGS